MKLARLQLGPLVLILVLTVWVAGLFLLPLSIWLQPFAYGSVEGLSGPVKVAGADSRPGRAHLARVKLGRGQATLLRIKVKTTGSFGLQVKDRATGEVVRVFRLPKANQDTEHILVLDSRSLPKRLRLTAWNRGRDPLEIEGISSQGLRPHYLWAQRLYRSVGPLLLLGLALANRKRLRGYIQSRAVRDSIAQPAWDYLAMALIFLLCFSVFRMAPVHQVLDSKFISVVSDAFIASGSLALPDDFAPARRTRQIYTLRPVGERTYHFFSSAPAVLNAPFVAMFEWAGVSPVGEGGRFLGHNEQKILRFIAAFVAAALCSVWFLTARIWLSPAKSGGATLVFAFGSQILSTVSRPFWSHSWTTFLLASALLFLVSPTIRERRWVYVLISTLLCWSYFCRPPLSLAVVGVTLYVLWARRRFLIPYLGTGMVWASLFVFYSLRTYDTWLPPYFLSSHLKSGRLAGGLLISSYPEAVLGTLISPGRGLFVYVPFVVVILAVVVRRWRWLPDRQLATVALGVCIAHWQLVSLFRNWWGGQSFGPRLMSDVLPWLFLLAVFALAALESVAAKGLFRWTPLKVTAVSLLVAMSVFINVRGAVAQETQRGAGIWNWRYPQFMAGLIPRPDTNEESKDQQ